MNTPKGPCRVYDLLGNRILGFPKLRGTSLIVLKIRIIVVWGLYWGPLI